MNANDPYPEQQFGRGHVFEISEKFLKIEDFNFTKPNVIRSEADKSGQEAERARAQDKVWTVYLRKFGISCKTPVDDFFKNLFNCQ